MRLPDSEKKNEIEKQANCEKQSPDANVILSHHNQATREQDHNGDELKSSPCREQYRTAEEYGQALRPAFPHGAEGAVHSGAHQASAMAKPDPVA
jgi:hypothetical protein